MHKIQTILLLFLLFSACGPTLTKLTINPPPIKKVVLLPIIVNTEISKEDVNNVRDLFVVKLQQQGYEVLDPTWVDELCGEEIECVMGKKDLINDFSPDAFVVINLDSSFATNFIAGYYNTLGGELFIEGQDGMKFYTITHSESERGGLIFNSGQVLQGIKETIEDWTSVPLKRISQKFAESVVYVFPKPFKDKPSVSNNKNEENLDIEIMNLSNLDQSMICLNSDKKGKANITVDRVSYSLRSSRNTTQKFYKYCSILPLKDLLAGSSQESIEVSFSLPFQGTRVLDITERIQNLDSK